MPLNMPPKKFFIYLYIYQMKYFLSQFFVVAFLVKGRRHTLLGFFSMLQTQLFGYIKPQNTLCISLEVPISYYFQYKSPYRSCLFHLILLEYEQIQWVFLTSSLRQLYHDNIQNGIRQGRKGIIQLMTLKGVCKTALATPCLLTRRGRTC